MHGAVGAQDREKKEGTVGDPEKMVENKFGMRGGHLRAKRHLSHQVHLHRMKSRDEKGEG